MKRAALCALPYLVALLVPTVVFGVLFALSNQSPFLGLFGGGIGLVGALSALATRVLLAPRMTESEIEALARELDEEEDWGDHEGLRRLHEDIRRDEQRRHISPYDEDDDK